jgi:3-(3-hydroxy-phenyl)propionate hydroxylase/6-hydroxy-3-succinoylpyridine 3-monooxygenase
VSADQVIIVGAGPVGLVTAYGLGRAGIPVTVLEAEPEINDSPRAMVYHWSLHEDLDRLGLLADVERLGFRKDDYGYRVHATGETVVYDLDALAQFTPFPYNIHLGQDAVCSLVLERLHALPQVTVHWGARVTGLSQSAEGATVEIAAAGGEGQRTIGATGAWVIGCDGARSSVRRLLGLEFEGMTWDTRFVATNVYFDFERHGYPRSVFLMDDVHGAVIVKINDDGLWRVTYAEDLALPEETIAERIPEHYAALLPGGGPYELDRYAPYRLHQRCVAQMRSGRVLLAGDAAHATNPTGGFGLAGGLFDAFALIDALGAVICDDADEALIDAWAAERRRIFVEVASPAATRLKKTVYDSGRAAAEQTLADLRRMVADPVALRERLTFPAKLRSAARGRSDAAGPADGATTTRSPPSGS